MAAADPLSEFITNNRIRIDQMCRRFGTYQPQHVDRERIRAWLNQFRPDDFDLALRVLETVQFYDVARLQDMLFHLHRVIKVRLALDGYRGNDNLVYLPVAGAGESGQVILAQYRNVNRLRNTTARLAQVLELFDLLFEAESLGRELVLVFVDDFIGTGKKICDFWNEVLTQLILRPSQAAYIAVPVACQTGIERIELETPLQVIPLHIVQPRHLLMDSDQFSDPEKNRIVEYCETVGNPPLGIGKLGVLVAFDHSIPNNTISILRGSKRQNHWPGILPRFDDLP
jgi:hypothetical protein